MPKPNLLNREPATLPDDFNFVTPSTFSFGESARSYKKKANHSYVPYFNQFLA